MFYDFIVICQLLFVKNDRYTSYFVVAVFWFSALFLGLFFDDLLCYTVVSIIDNFTILL